MKIFIELIDRGIWDAIVNGPLKKMMFSLKTLVPMD